MPAYEILAKLAQGATAELFAARATDRIVVIKRLRAADVDAAKAFLAEALVAATLDHPNIVKVFDVSSLNGAYILTREYVDGETLASFAAHARVKKIQVPLRAILTIAAGAAEGLQYAHERSMHGDLSLPNVIVSHDGTVKLLEVTGGDRSGDLVALGRALWELLTLGDSSTSPDNAAALPAPSKTRFDIPAELDLIVVRLLAGQYESADDLLGAIDLLAAKLGFQLSTSELSRMMRLWFGAPPEAPQRPLVPIPVTTEPVGHDVALALATAQAVAADDPLARVRDDDDARGAVAALATTRTREERVTAVPGFGEPDPTREHFEQIRDRILAHARKKKETRPPIPEGALPSRDFTPAPTEAAPFDVDVESTPPPVNVRRKPDTLDPNLNAYAYITQVAETATAPIQTITKGETSAATSALRAASTQAEAPAQPPSEPSADAPPVPGRVSTLRMGEVVARPAPASEPRVAESAPVKLGPELASVADTAPVASPRTVRESIPPIEVDEASILAEAASTVDETVVVDEIALPRPGRTPPPALASVAAERLGDSRSPHTRRTAEMAAIDIKAEDAMATLVDTRSPDAKARDNAKTTAQMRAIDVHEVAAIESDAARLAYAKAIDTTAKAGDSSTDATPLASATSPANAASDTKAAPDAMASSTGTSDTHAAASDAAPLAATPGETTGSGANASAATAKASDAKTAAASATVAKGADSSAAGAKSAASSDAKAAASSAADAKTATSTSAADAKAAASSAADAKAAPTTSAADAKTAGSSAAKSDAKAAGSSAGAAKSDAADAKPASKSRKAEAVEGKPGSKRADQSSGSKSAKSTETKTMNGVGKHRHGDPARLDPRSATSKAATPVSEDHEGSGKGWLVPGLLVLAVAAGIMLFAKRGDDRKPSAAHRDDVAAVPHEAPPRANETQQLGATHADQVAVTAGSNAGAPVGAADQAAAEQTAKDKAAQEEAARLAAEQAAQQKAADDKAAKLAAEQTAKQKAADDKAAKLAADQAAKQKAAEEKAAKAAADKAAKEKATADRLAAAKAAKEKAAEEKAAKLAADKAAKEKAAADRLAAAKVAKEKAAAGRVAKSAVDKAVRASADKPKAGTDAASIEDLYAAGDYTKTNSACTSNVVFTAAKLKLCALAACHTSHLPLAKRWVNAIAKASRDEIIAQCKTLGLELEQAPPAAAQTPAPAQPPAPAPQP